ncbi:MAG TPA: adenylate/guanylate cyclase domain-containing protein [Acidimicrobiia bacterium]|nr:adenylate/guanylate cyclase domain-containing protein [Acidimicrobiia bacterium]
MSASPAGTVVFTDIVGFTEFTAEHGDEQALALLERQERVVRDALPRDARVVKDLGDGFMLWFPEAVSAVQACLALSERFEEDAATDVPLWVRVGMHWGCPTRRGDDLVGHDVNIASRIVDVAGPGEVLLSDPVRELVDGRVPDLRLDELGPVVMKGIPDAVRLYRATLPEFGAR